MASEAGPWGPDFIVHTHSIETISIDAESPAEEAKLASRPSRHDDRALGGDKRNVFARHPSFARSRYVLTNNGSWARLPTASPTPVRRMARVRTKEGMSRKGSAEKDACSPGLFLIRYLHPSAANMLAGDMRLVPVSML